MRCSRAPFLVRFWILRFRYLNYLCVLEDGCISRQWLSFVRSWCPKWPFPVAWTWRGVLARWSRTGDSSLIDSVLDSWCRISAQTMAKQKWNLSYFKLRGSIARLNHTWTGRFRRYPKGGCVGEFVNGAAAIRLGIVAGTEAALPHASQCTVVPFGSDWFRWAGHVHWGFVYQMTIKIKKIKM